MLTPTSLPLTCAHTGVYVQRTPSGLLSLSSFDGSGETLALFYSIPFPWQNLSFHTCPALA
jgi:hypothetical protein